MIYVARATLPGKPSDAQYAALFIVGDVELDTHSSAVMRIITLEQLAGIARTPLARELRHSNNK